MLVVDVESLWVRYGQLAAVRGISLQIPRGEVFGFIGPNGAGKSSTIKVLATLLRDFTGKVKINGLDVLWKPQAVREKIGYVPDFFGRTHTARFVTALPPHRAHGGGGEGRPGIGQRHLPPLGADAHRPRAGGRDERRTGLADQGRAGGQFSGTAGRSPGHPSARR